MATARVVTPTFDSSDSEQEKNLLVQFAPLNAPRSEPVAVPLTTPVSLLRRAAAKLLKLRDDETTLVAGGRRWAVEDDQFCMMASGDTRHSDTVGDLMWLPLGAVDTEPLVFHVLCNVSSRRTVAIKVRVRNQRLSVNVCQCDGPAELRAAVLREINKEERYKGMDVRLVYRGGVLDASQGLPLVEYGLDDGQTVLAIPHKDPNRSLRVCVKVLDAPAITVDIRASGCALDIKRMVLERLPSDICARVPHLVNRKSQVFVGRIEAGSSVQKMSDDETVGAHNELGAEEDGNAVLFLVPPAGRVGIELGLGPGMSVCVPESKENMLGLRQCYEESIENCRTELRAQRGREAARAQAERVREERRAARRHKQHLQAKQHAANSTDSHRPTKSKRPKKNGMRGGFFGTPAIKTVPATVAPLNASQLSASQADGDAGSRLVRDTLVERITALEAQKEKAVAADDFEKAVVIREELVALRSQQEQHLLKKARQQKKRLVQSTKPAQVREELTLSKLQCAALAISLRIHGAARLLRQPLVAPQPLPQKIALLQERGLCELEQVAAVCISKTHSNHGHNERGNGEEAKLMGGKTAAMTHNATSGTVTAAPRSGGNSVGQPAIRGIVNRKVSAGIVLYKVRFSQAKQNQGSPPDAWIDGAHLDPTLIADFERRRADRTRSGHGKKKSSAAQAARHLQRLDRGATGPEEHQASGASASNRNNISHR